MAVLEVHVSVFAPERETAIAQALIRERVPIVPDRTDSIREIDWVHLRDVLRALAEDTTGRVEAQLAQLEEWHEAKGTVPGDDDDGNGNGNGNGSSS